MTNQTDLAYDCSEAEEFGRFMDELEEQENEQYNSDMEELCCQLKNER